MAAFRKMINALRSNKTISSCDMSMICDKSLVSTYSDNNRPSTHSFCNNFDISHRTSDGSSHPINYANELSNWRQLDTINTTMPGVGGNAIMPAGYYGQYGYADPYAGAMSYQTSNYGYPFISDNHPLMPTDNAMFSDNRLMGAENHLPPMAQLASLSESRSQCQNVRTDTFVPLDKLKRMRAAKDLYNVLNYLDNDDCFLRKPNKSSSTKSKENRKKQF